MALRQTIKYPNGGKLLIFCNGKTKYLPSQTYLDMKAAMSKAPSSITASEKYKQKVGHSTFSNAAKLFNALFKEKLPEEKPTGAQALFNMNLEENNQTTVSKVLPVINSTSTNYQRTSSFG